MDRITSKQIAAALEEAGFRGVRVEKCDDVGFCFVGGDTATWYNTQVFVARLSEWTLQQWVDEALFLKTQEAPMKY